MPPKLCVPAVANKLLHAEFWASPLPPVLELENLIFPPALKKNRACSELLKLIVAVQLTELAQELVKDVDPMPSVTNWPVPKSKRLVADCVANVSY